jgi:Fe-S cluster assembly ATPase SufC
MKKRSIAPQLVQLVQRKKKTHHSCLIKAYLLRRHIAKGFSGRAIKRSKLISLKLSITGWDNVDGNQITD